MVPKRRVNDCFDSGIRNFRTGYRELSGRVLDLRPKSCRFEPHQCFCVVVLEQDTFILV